MFFPHQISSSFLSPYSLDQVPYTGLSVYDYQSPGAHAMSFSPVDSEDLTLQGSIISHRRNGSTTSNIGRFISDTPSDHLNSSELSPLHQGTTEVSISESNSGPQPMPPSGAFGPTPAELVHRFRHSPYVTDNRLEPTDYRRRSLFLQLLLENPPHHYECIVPRSNGTPCGKTFNRSDRGLTHIRTHFNHRPYSCDGQCNNKRW